MSRLETAMLDYPRSRSTRINVDYLSISDTYAKQLNKTLLMEAYTMQLRDSIWMLSDSSYYQPDVFRAPQGRSTRASSGSKGRSLHCNRREVTWIGKTVPNEALTRLVVRIYCSDFQ